MKNDMIRTVVYHGSENSLTFDELMLENTSSTGVHFGSKKAAVVAVNKYYNNAEDWTEEEISSFHEENPEAFIKVVLSPSKMYENATDSNVNSMLFIENLIERGYDCVSYINEFEDIGSISYVVLNPKIVTEI